LHIPDWLFTAVTFFLIKKTKGRLMDPDIHVPDGYGVLTREEEEFIRAFMAKKYTVSSIFP